jgi:4-amino-4-deoxy-L-arabinose transferase-like glycosyltransferase
MKNIELLFNQFAGHFFVKPYALTSTRKLYTFVALATFFLIITAQLFWSTIHGDGAVYAWLIREVSEGGFFSSQLPKWTQTQFFAEHPYLFFYFGALFTKIFGYSDLALKIPNFVVAAFSLLAVYKVAALRQHGQERSHQIGLIAGYVLIFDAAYMLQISQPSLDPLAQLLALVSVVSFVYYQRSFLAGLFMGLAFLTKGVEILPNFAALFMLSCYLRRKNTSQLFKNLFLMLIGLLIPLLVWFGVDHFVWGGRWV